MPLFPNILAASRRKSVKTNEDSDSSHRVMSPKRWILLLIFYISYLMFGASIYYHIEHREENLRRHEEWKEQTDMNEYLLQQLADKNDTTQEEVLDKISDYCGKPVTAFDDSEYEKPFTWTFYHSFFFAFTVCSTVGYGNISPTTDVGRIIMIFYSVIGIPVNGILFAGLGEYFSKTFEAIYRRYKKYKMSRNDHYVPPQLGLVTIVLIALIPGIALFLLLPAWIFSYFEGWSYTIAFYYSYVTTTTIGFGDYVPTFQSYQPKKFGGWFVVYQIFIIIWFIFSLGYLLMIMTFITRGLQSKKLSQLEQQLSSNIKATQNRIWNGVTKDVGYLRRILNEMYILKVQPVYSDEDYSLPRSLSCPDLTMYRVDPPRVYSRKRAYSECYGAHDERAAGEVTPPLVYSSSDTELNKFDRQKTFENAEAFRQTAELLSKVVNALSSVKPPEADDDASSSMYGGYHGFSDSQILASEYPTYNEMPKPRGRACSDFNINPRWEVQRPTVGHAEWTWSGDNNQIQEAINNRYKQGNGQQPLSAADLVNLEAANEADRKPRVKKFSIPDGFRRLFRRRPSEDLLGNVSAPSKSHRKFSIMSVPETHQYRGNEPLPPSDYYSTVTANASPSFFQNGVANPAVALNRMVVFPSDSSITSKRSVAFDETAERRQVEPEQATFTPNDVFPPAYQAHANGAFPRKRRESIYAQNPALAGRRASMFPATATRRGSLFSAASLGGGVAAASGIPPRRGSLFPPSTGSLLPGVQPRGAGRRPSLFSVRSDQDMDVLENTTLADLIRALEAVHTKAALDEPRPSAARNARLEMGGIFGMAAKKKRHLSTADEPSQMPGILSLFSGDDSKALSTAATNRLYARRATIVGAPLMAGAAGALPSYQPPLSINSTASSVLTRRRKSSAIRNAAEPPPSYTERDNNGGAASSGGGANAATSSKFKRRFSVRPTALQIPPGKAPPPGVNINTIIGGQQQQQLPTQPPVPSLPPASAIMQRRMSLRPSPLAREFTVTPWQASPLSSGSGSSSNQSATIIESPSSSGTSPTSASPTRLLLPPSIPPRPANITSSSTHSPLSRIVQISQAQRKSSMPDSFAQDRNNKKPDDSPSSK